MGSRDLKSNIYRKERVTMITESEFTNSMAGTYWLYRGSRSGRTYNGVVEGEFKEFRWDDNQELLSDEEVEEELPST